MGFGVFLIYNQQARGEYRYQYYQNNICLRKNSKFHHDGSITLVACHGELCRTMAGVSSFDASASSAQASSG